MLLGALCSIIACLLALQAIQGAWEAWGSMGNLTVLLKNIQSEAMFSLPSTNRGEREAVGGEPQLRGANCPGWHHSHLKPMTRNPKP